MSLGVGFMLIPHLGRAAPAVCEAQMKLAYECAQAPGFFHAKVEI